MERDTKTRPDMNRAIALRRLNRSCLNKFEHVVKTCTNVPIPRNKVFHSFFVLRKISTLTFGTDLVYSPCLSNRYGNQFLPILKIHCNSSLRKHDLNLHGNSLTKN